MAFKQTILKVILILAIVQLGYDCDAAVSHGGKGDKKTHKNAEGLISKKLKSATPAQLNKYKMIAAKRMVVDVSKAMQVVSVNKDVPDKIQDHAKTLLTSLKDGKLTPAFAKSMGTILQNGSKHQGKPVQQLAIILKSILPSSPLDLGNAVQGTLSFLTGNVSGATSLITNVSTAVPDLLEGTVSSLSGSLGAVTDSLDGSVASLGGLMGGLL